MSHKCGFNYLIFISKVLILTVKRQPNVYHLRDKVK